MLCIGLNEKNLILHGLHILSLINQLLNGLDSYKIFKYTRIGEKWAVKQEKASGMSKSIILVQRQDTQYDRYRVIPGMTDDRSVPGRNY